MTSFFKRARARWDLAEKKILGRWIRFSETHRHSVWVPILLFSLLFADGFVMVIPSMPLLMAAVAMHPRRWLLYALLFTIAATINNACTYAIGRMIPAETIESLISTVGLTHTWESARHALEKYGAWASLIGALIGLPVQMITALIGMGDAALLHLHPTATAQFFRAILFAFVGHGTKTLIFGLLIRRGWLKIEERAKKSNLAE